jgi:hypothetical protein
MKKPMQLRILIKEGPFGLELLAPERSAKLQKE